MAGAGFAFALFDDPSWWLEGLHDDDDDDAGDVWDAETYEDAIKALQAQIGVCNHN